MSEQESVSGSRHRGRRITARRVILSTLLVGAVGLAAIVNSAGDEKVDQPIVFPHKIHAAPAAEGGHEISCLYCHTYARRSPVAGIPPLAKCMGCHRFIATDREPIKQLTEYWNSRKPVPWKKVHDLPDFVRFPHQRHVQHFVFNAGQPVAQACGYCHGDVMAMTVAEKRRPLTMGWCLGCHEQFQGNGTQVPQPAGDWVVPAHGTEALPGTGGAARAKAPGDCWECHK